MRIKPLKKPNNVPKNKFPVKFQLTIFDNNLLIIPPIIRTITIISKRANQIRDTSDSIEERKYIPRLKSKVKVAQNAMIQTSKEKISDTNPLKNPTTVEIATVPRKIKSKIDIISFEPKISIGKYKLGKTM